MLQEALEAGQKALTEAVSSRLNELLMLAVTHLLCRSFHERRETNGIAVSLFLFEQYRGYRSVRLNRKGQTPRNAFDVDAAIEKFQATATAHQTYAKLRALNDVKPTTMLFTHD
jgi:hypothetical protein